MSERPMSKLKIWIIKVCVIVVALAILMILYSILFDRVYVGW